MAIGFRASSAAAGVSPLSVSMPAGTAVGDLLLMIADTANSAAAAASGWTVAATSPVWSANHVSTVLWKIAGASEPAASVTTTGGANIEALICGFTGVDSTTPIDAAAAFGAASSGGTVPVPAITTITANAWWVTVGADSAGGLTSSSKPAGWTQRALPAATTVAGHVCNTLLVAAAGAQSATSFPKGGGVGIAAGLALRESGAALTPVANFTGTPLTGNATLSVAFTDTSTNTPTSWAWDFGDSGTSTSQNPSHNYTAAGNYTVELDATNAAGTDTEAKVAYVTVTEPAAIEGVSIAFDDTPMTAEPEWTRIDTLEGCRVQEWTIDRGRPTEFDKTDTGTAVVRIIDREGLFDPTNTFSDYYLKALPGKQAAIALQNPVSDEWFTLFRGFIESWHYRLDQTRQYMELELQLVDGFAMLARAILEPGEHGVIPGPPPYTSPPYASDEEAAAEEALAGLAEGNVLYGETIGSVKDRIDGILDDVGWPDPPMRDVFSGNTRIGPKAYAGASALDGIWDAVDGEFVGVANCWMSKEGVFVFRGRQARFRPDVAAYNINERTVGSPPYTDPAVDPEGEVVPLSELEWSVGQDNLFNAVSATPQWVGSGRTIRQLNPGPPDNDNVEGQYVKDDTSIAAYGLRSLTFDQLQTVEGIATGSNSMQETKKVATYYKENFSEATPRITRMVFKSRRPGNLNGTALWNHLCRCEISDLLTLKTEHPGDGGFTTEQFYVEGIHYTCRPGPPAYPIIELSLDVSPLAHYTTNPFDEDGDPA